MLNKDYTISVEGPAHCWVFASLCNFAAFLSHSLLYVKYLSLERKEGNADVR